MVPVRVRTQLLHVAMVHTFTCTCTHVVYTHATVHGHVYRDGMRAGGYYCTAVVPSLVELKGNTFKPLKGAGPSNNYIPRAHVQLYVAHICPHNHDNNNEARRCMQAQPQHVPHES